VAVCSLAVRSTLVLLLVESLGTRWRVSRNDLGKLGACQARSKQKYGGGRTGAIRERFATLSFHTNPVGRKWGLKRMPFGLFPSGTFHSQLD
jgi:hypothetical protein